MVLMETPPVEAGWQAADFLLPDPDGKEYSLADVKGENGLVVMFIANHCPYVQCVVDKIARDMQELQALGVGAIAVASSDITSYPQDGPDAMRRLAEQKGFCFPYVFDDSQQVAQDYGAVCTPDFFGFDKELKLRYRGRLDGSGMDFTEGLPRDLFEAMQQVAETGTGPEEQHPSMGCSIKWK